MERLTPQEEEIMMMIWDKGPCFIKEIWEAMAEPRMPYTTLASVFKNLEKKAFVSARKRGASYEYTPLVTAADYSSTTISRLVGRFFEGSYQSLVSFFAKGEKVSEEELAEILEMMKKNQ